MSPSPVAARRASSTPWGSWSSRNAPGIPTKRLPWVQGAAALPIDEGPTEIASDGSPVLSASMKGRLYGIPGWKRWSHPKRMRKLRQMAQDYGREPMMRFFVVHHVLKPAGVGDFRQYAKVAAALLKWVQENVYYTNEADEQLQSPWWTLRVRTGDCDDMAILLAAMAHSVRLPWRYVLSGRNKRGQFFRWHEGQPFPRGCVPGHIYLDLGWPPFTEGKKDAYGRELTQWAAAEPTMKGVPLGADIAVQMASGRGGGRLPELGGLAGPSAMVSGSGSGTYGAWGAAPAEMTDPEQLPLPQRVLNQLDAADLLADGIKAAITALVAGYILSEFRKKK